MKLLLQWLLHAIAAAPVYIYSYMMLAMEF